MNGNDARCLAETTAKEMCDLLQRLEDDLAAEGFHVDEVTVALSSYHLTGNGTVRRVVTGMTVSVAV